MSEWFDHMTTLVCTCERMTFHDDQNEFGLEVPEGAIPKQSSITIDIGVALYGPFKYPDGLRPVSPVFWICTRDPKLFKFEKPATVTIPHCLKVESADSLGLTFLKGKHEANSDKVYQFERVDEVSEMVFEAHHTNATLKTTHFCSLCIAGAISPELDKNTKFCIYAAIPPVVTPNQPSNCRFFVSFLLPTCIETVEKQIKQVLEFKLHTKILEDFKFSTKQDDSALSIILPVSPSNEYTVGLQGKTEVSYYVMMWCSFSSSSHRFY